MAVIIPLEEEKDVKDETTAIPCDTNSAIQGCSAGAPAGPVGWWCRVWQDPTRRASLLWRLSLVMLVLIVVVIVFKLVLGFGSGAAAGPEIPWPEFRPEANLTMSAELRIIPRRGWLAKSAREHEFHKTPVPYVIVSHSASEGCDTHASCIALVRSLQSFHMESRGWSDVAFNFMVGGNGYVYEGRGWNIIGAHAYGYNNRSIGLNMLGTFIYELPPERQLLALRKLIELGVSDGHIAEDYKLLAARQVLATESPGTALYKELQTWPHWSATP